MTHDGYLAIFRDDKTLYAWDIKKREDNFPDGKYVILGSHDGRVGLFDMAEKKLVKISSNEHNAQYHSSIEITEDSKFFVTTSYADEKQEAGLAVVWNYPELTVAHKLKNDTYISKIAVTRDSQHLITADSDKKMSVWNLQTGEVVHEFKSCHKKDFSGLAVSQDSKTIISCTSQKDCAIWSIEEKKELYRFPSGEGPKGQIALTIIDEIEHIVAQKEDNSVGVWRVDTQIQKFEVPKHGQHDYNWVTSSLEYLYFAEDQQYGVRPLNSFKLSHTFPPGHTAGIEALVPAKFGGNQLAIAVSKDNTIGFWDFTSKSHLHKITDIYLKAPLKMAI
eukprot:CAMPEP_0176421482 /NCGR_PEP_ID=MMETSP0127-20121128/9198_1 /TAXON_ID=938130 /ORGANISM="Platyophrya macrostoma, Strain WH" /LENGTH=333 /DNA_ID=CAMNT_0017802217 /DNA_START=10 /DNA_END=1009 /DNA_ORIENTATION=+